jgi:hypothetical protein
LPVAHIKLNATEHI